MSCCLVLFNDTLRWHDNPLLGCTEANKVAVVILDHDAFFGHQHAIYRANLARLQQQFAVIVDFKQRLAKNGIGLITLTGKRESCLKTLAKQLNATSLLCAEPVAANESKAVSQLANKLNIQQIDCNSLFDEAFRPELTSLADSFTPFRKRFEPQFQVTNITSPAQLNGWMPVAETEKYNAAFNALLNQYLPEWHSLEASEHGALERVAQYIWHQQHILHYKQSRNQLYGDNYASFCSVPLSLGTLSVRQLWREISKFEAEIMANDSTYWLKFELLWREFFRWQFRKYGARWFSLGAIKYPADFHYPELNPEQKHKFNQWCAGQTGETFIDANMTLLNKTGLMSNRGRQNVASYLIHDLQLDWRLGAAYFEQRLLDYDCASNWGNWAYIAGTGNSEKRQFNIKKQAQIYDTHHSFTHSMLALRDSLPAR